MNKKQSLREYMGLPPIQDPKTCKHEKVRELAYWSKSTENQKRCVACGEVVKK